MFSRSLVEKPCSDAFAKQPKKLHLLQTMRFVGVIFETARTQTADPVEYTRSSEPFRASASPCELPGLEDCPRIGGIIEPRIAGGAATKGSFLGWNQGGRPITESDSVLFRSTRHSP